METEKTSSELAKELKAVVRTASDTTRDQFDQFWTRTNNAYYFRNRIITVEILKQVAGEAWSVATASAGALAASPESSPEELAANPCGEAAAPAPKLEEIARKHFPNDGLWEGHWSDQRWAREKCAAAIREALAEQEIVIQKSKDMSDDLRGGICCCYNGDTSRCPIHQTKEQMAELRSKAHEALAYSGIGLEEWAEPLECVSSSLKCFHDDIQNAENRLAASEQRIADLEQKVLRLNASKQEWIDKTLKAQIELKLLRERIADFTAMKSRAEAAEAQLAAVRETLAGHEWDESGWCSVCDWDKDHSPHCWLASLLARLKAGKP